jgi:hypothetical protein
MSVGRASGDAQSSSQDAGSSGLAGQAAAPGQGLTGESLDVVVIVNVFGGSTSHDSAAGLNAAPHAAHSSASDAQVTMHDVTAMDEPAALIISIDVDLMDTSPDPAATPGPQTFALVLFLELAKDSAGATVHFSIQVDGVSMDESGHVGTTVTMSAGRPTNYHSAQVVTPELTEESINLTAGANSSAGSVSLSSQDGTTHMDALFSDGFGERAAQASNAAASDGVQNHANVASAGDTVASGARSSTPAPQRLEQMSVVAKGMRWNVVVDPDSDSVAASSPLPRLDLTRRSQGPSAKTGAATNQKNKLAEEDLPVLDLAGILAQAMYLGNWGRFSGDMAANGNLPGVTSDAGLPVAALVQQSTEAFTRLVQELYTVFLGRSARPGEEQGWVGALLGGQTEEQLLSAFLATPEFYGRASMLTAKGTADEKFISGLYRMLLQRAPNETELSSWLNGLSSLGHRGVVSYIVSSQEYRALRVADFYRDILHDPAQPNEVAQWASSPFDLLTIRQFLALRAESLAKNNS